MSVSITTIPNRSDVLRVQASWFDAGEHRTFTVALSTNEVNVFLRTHPTAWVAYN